jgi:ABC-type multidrug transport system ATPase subunit
MTNQEDANRGVGLAHGRSGSSDEPTTLAAPSQPPTATAGPSPMLAVSALGRRFTVGGADPVGIGRDRTNSLVIPDPRVSRFHARLRREGRVWWLEDLGSLNGTHQDGRRVERLAIESPTQVRLGGGDGVLLELEPMAAPQGPPRSSLRVGRCCDNDLVVSDLSVSRHHARLLPEAPGEWQLIDLGSSNGTFVNGQRVQQARVREGDVIGLGAKAFCLRGGRLEPWVSEEPALEAQGLTVRGSGGTTLLDEVSFSLPERSLLAVVGPSGAGKTTLLGALTGLRPAQEGRTLVGGRDLYQAYDELRLQIGYVPQDDVLHTGLTVRRALRYAAELRFGDDVSGHERRARVEEVLAELGIASRADLRIARLSGGQRKRVSIALELLTRPSLLFLDEPTSGLDPGMEKHLMQLLRDLADAGRTVVVVTHSVQSLSLCHRVLFLAPGGRVAFYGPPQDVTRHFGCDDVAEVFARLEQHPETGREVRAGARTDGLTSGPPRVPWPTAASRTTGQGPGPLAPRRRKSAWRQLSTLTRRYLAVMASDPLNLAFLLCQAPILALIVLLAVAPRGFQAGSSGAVGTASEAGLILVVSATYLGLLNSVREVVKELPIYLRERTIGLSIPAYLGSKVIVLSAVTVAQAAILVAIGAAREGSPGVGAFLHSPSLELVLDVAAAGVAALALGLLVSCLVNRADKALTLLPLLVVPQFVLTFPQLHIDEKPILRQLSYAASAQWAYSAVASTVNLNQLDYLQARAANPRIPPGQDANASSAALDAAIKRVTDLRPQARWQHRPGAWGEDMLVLGGMVLVSLLLAGLALRRRDPRPGRRRHVPAPGRGDAVWRPLNR